MESFKNRFDLESLILQETKKVNELEESGKLEEAQRVADYVSELSAKLKLTGIVRDPLTQEKYFLSNGELKGGIISYSDECRDHNSYTLYSKDQQPVLDALAYFVKERNKTLLTVPSVAEVGLSIATLGIGRAFNLGTIPAVVGIYIRNNSKYKLEYVNCGNSEGYFFTGRGDASISFAGANKTIEPYHVAGFVHTKMYSSTYGSAGWIAFRLRTDLKNFIIIMGWGSFRGSKNRAGLEKRSVVDNAEVTSAVADFGKFLVHTHHGGDGLHLINEEIVNVVKLKYWFSNERVCKYGFQLIIDDWA